ncbi:uncharacterized protein LOC116348025 [Contarinia nasturtii]|uniref:uncharacterized protein LOC116348025 n=1 Tax=Contarinia nasturtii TaxID=265458 RepID=UPI0012D41E59|nr:uncharacterized protein LOC116348025 [Contarinia nasturtii]
MGKEFDIVKSKGSENFHSWKFAIENVLAFQELSTALKPASTLTPNIAVLTDAAKLAKAKAIISLSVETHIYVHIQTAESALEIWNILKNLYEDRGLSSEISLWHEVTTTRLEDCDNMNDYIAKLKSSFNKLHGIGFPMNDRAIVAFTLAGLTEEFRPVIYSLETNTEPVTSDFVNSKLFDLQLSNASSAFFNKGKKFKKPKRKCFSCGSKFHLSNACDKKESKNDQNDKKSDRKDDSKKKAAFVTLICKDDTFDDEWHIDSGCGRHMTPSDKNMRSVKHFNISEITSANNGKMKVEKRGKVTIELKDTEIEADDVLHMPDIVVNLLSVYKICQKGNIVIFNKNACTIKMQTAKLL